MHYYQRHIGDYHRDAGYLSTLKHGIYTLLMDWYYANERPIPDDIAHEIARVNREETQSVLVGFFKFDEQGQVWRSDRIDREISAYHRRSDANRENGKKGGRPAKSTTSKNHKAENPVGTQSGTQSKANQEPLDPEKHPPLTPPSGGESPPVARKGRAKTELHEIGTFLATIAKGERVFPPGSPLVTYCETVGLPTNLVKLAWFVFVQKMRDRRKRQRDWRKTFQNYVESNYLRLWYVDDDGGFTLTTTGIQAQRKMNKENSDG